MRKSIKKTFALLLAFAMILSIVPVSAATLVEGENGKTVYISLSYSSDPEGLEKITNVGAGETFYMWVDFAGNPTVLKESIQSYDLLISYDSTKISLPYGDESYFEGKTNPTFRSSFKDGVCYAGWASTSGIAERRVIIPSGNLFSIEAEATVALSESDLRSISLINEADNGEKKQITQIQDGSKVPFTIVITPAISVGEVSGNIYSSTTANEIKDMIQSFSYISETGEAATYTNADSQWADLEVVLPEDGLTIGKNTLTAKYNGYTCSFEVEVLDSIKSIAVTTPPTYTEYTAFNTFDPTGMVVTATYESGKTEDVTTQCTVDTTTPLKVADKSWTITLGDKTTTQAITVIPFEVKLPQASDDVLVYTGATQSFSYKNAVDTERVTITGDTRGKDAKTYNATATLKDKANTAWPGGSTTDVKLSWTIQKAKITSGIDSMTKKYTTTYAQLPTTANMTGVNSEVIPATISWYKDAACEQAAASNSQIVAEYTGEGQTATLYYKATGMANYKDYKGSVVVNVAGKDEGTITWKNLPTGLSASGEAISGTYSESGYTLSANMFAVASMAGASLGEAKAIKINGETATKITNAGTYVVTVMYEDNDNIAEKEFTVVINPKSIENAKVSVKMGSDSVATTSENPLKVVYTGSIIAPEVSVVEGVAQDGYEVDVQSAKDVSGTVYRIAVTGKGNYTGTTYGYWTIIPAEIELKTAVIADKKFDGTVEGASVTDVVFDGLLGNDALVKGVDYDVVSAVFTDANVSDSVNVNVTVALKSTVKNYVLKTATALASGKVIKADAPVLSALSAQTLLSSAVVQGTKNYSFNLEGIINGIPANAGAVTYTFKTEGAYVKKDGTGIDGSTLKAIVEAQVAAVTDTITITVSTANYGDADVVLSFEFKNKTAAQITLNNVDAIYGDEYTVAGSYANQPQSGYTWTYEYVGIEGTNYPASDVKPVKAGKYSIKARYEDNTPDSQNPEIPGHVGEATATLTIAKKSLTLASGDVSVVKVYDGTTEPGTLSGTLVVEGVNGEDVVSIDMTNAVAGPYGEANVGNTYTVVITGFALAGEDKDNYTISESYSFEGAKITKQLQSAVTINGSNENIPATYGDAVTIVVGGGNGTGEYTLTSSDSTILNLVKIDGTTWNAEILKIGEVTLTASKNGDDNYEPSTEVTVTFVISPKSIVESDFEIDLAEKVFTGTEIKPAVTATALSATEDFEVVYASNINAGTATITITGKGNYTGEIIKTFAIAPKAITEDEFTLSAIGAEYTYTGAQIAPEVSIAWEDTALVSGTDYSVVYANNTNAGTATVTITGTGNYTGTIVKTFTINPAQCTGNVVVTANQETIVDGTVLEVTQQPVGDVFTYQWKKNGENIEGQTASSYTVTSADIGAAISVVVTFGGNYFGSVESAPLTVGKSVLTGTVTLSGTTDITAVIENAPAAENYIVVWLRDGVEIAGAEGTTYSVANEDKGCDISVKLVATGDAYTGAILSNVISVPAEAPSFAQDPTAVASRGSITVSFAANANGSAITNYIIKLDGVEVANLTSGESSYVINGLTSGTTYTIQVVAVNSIGSTASNEVTATIPYASYGGGGSVATFYDVALGKVEGGKVTLNTKNTTAGSNVVIKVTPDEGYEISKVTVVDGKGNEIATTAAGNEYRFKMPKADVTVDVVLTKIAEDNEKEEEPVETAKFEDVKESDYFYDAVKWAMENKVTSGTAENTFSPNEECTRAQMVTFLWRAAGSPKAAITEHAFEDIDKNAYYYDAVLWAIENGITSGVSAIAFDPNGRVNRAQSVTFLWRIAKNPATETESPFEDVVNDSYYSNAVDWAVNANVTNGLSNTTFGPEDACTRAQIVTFIYRYFVK